MITKVSSRVQCSPIRSCFFPVLAPLQISECRQPCDLFSVHSSHLLQHPYERRRPPPRVVGLSTFAWMRYLCIGLFSPSRFSAQDVLRLSHMTANNVCICATQCFFTRWPLYRSFRKFSRAIR